MDDLDTVNMRCDDYDKMKKIKAVGVSVNETDK